MPAGSDKLVQRWLATRRRARHDLLFLAQQILGYKDITKDFHGPITKLLQNFPSPLPHQIDEYETHQGGTRFNYKPVVSLYGLPNARRRLILDPRGTFKTTINVIAHTVQWILNYPDVNLLIVHARLDWSEKILMTIAGHFLYNTTLRDLFPDYCPPKGKEKGFSNRSELWCPRRESSRQMRPEPTVGVASIDAQITGAHYDVIKFSDIVERENTKTGNQIQSVIDSFGYYQNILVRPESWIDVEGTPWDYSDLYQEIIKGESEKPIEEREWLIHVRGIYKKKLPPDVKDYTFLPEERFLPDIKDEHGLPVSWFPERFTVWQMEKRRKDRINGGYIFASQMLCNPVDTGDEKAFPRNLMTWIEPSDLIKIPMQYMTTTIDTAETEKEYSDFSTVTTCGWDAYGRCYVIDVRHAKMLPDQLIEDIVDVYTKYKPLRIQIEETGYVRGLKPSLLRACHLKGIFPPFEFLPRDNQQSKKDRILNTLQPYFRRREIKFLATLSCREALIEELTQFPKYKRDDILDTLADQFQNKEWFGREGERPGLQEMLAKNNSEGVDYHIKVENAKRESVLKLLMKEEFDKLLDGKEEDPLVTSDREYFDKTGGL